MIDPVRFPAVPPPAWPPGWEDAEVVAGVLVEPESPPRALGPRPHAGAAYDRTGRIASSDRCGRLVSVLA